MGDFKRIWLQCPEDAGCCRKKGAVMDRITEAAELALQNSDFGPEIKKHFEGIIAERDELRAKLEAVRDEINREYGIRECLEFYANPHNWHTRRKCMVTGKVGVIESHCELAKNSIARSGRDNLERIDAILTKRNQGKEGE